MINPRIGREGRAGNKQKRNIERICVQEVAYFSYVKL